MRLACMGTRGGQSLERMHCPIRACLPNRQTASNGAAWGHAFSSAQAQVECRKGAAAAAVFHSERRSPTYLVIFGPARPVHHHLVSGLGRRALALPACGMGGGWRCSQCCCRRCDAFNMTV